MHDQGKGSFPQGMVIGHRYELLQTLRAESHGEVKLARDQVLDVDVGVKLLSNEDPEFDRILEYFRREALWGLRLHHPQILGVHQLDETAEAVFLIQEPFAGNSLWELLGHSEALTINDSLYFIEVLAQGVAYAHKQGVIHQHFNPKHVLVSATEGIKIINFAFPAEPSEIHASPETQAYIAPEVWAGRLPSPASNLFSLGVIGYRMLTGILPFPLLPQEGLPYLIDADPSHLDKIPEALRPLFIRCLQPQPEKRFHSATDFLARLTALREKLTSAGSKKIPRSEEAVVSPAVISSEPDPPPTPGPLEPEVEIDSDWQDSAPRYRRNFWDKANIVLTDQQQRLAEFFGPEPLRRNRNKKLAAGIGTGLALLLLILGLNSLFTPKAKLKSILKTDQVAVDTSAPALPTPAPTPPPVLTASPTPPQESKPEPAASQPAPVKPAAGTAAAPATGAVSTSHSKVKTPATKHTSAPVVKPEKVAAKPHTAPPADAKTAKPAASPKMVATFTKEKAARQHADSLTKQGQRAIVKKATKGDKTVYQVWTTAGAAAKSAATPAIKPKTAGKTSAAKPR